MERFVGGYTAGLGGECIGLCGMAGLVAWMGDAAAPLPRSRRGKRGAEAGESGRYQEGGAVLDTVSVAAPPKRMGMRSKEDILGSFVAAG